MIRLIPAPYFFQLGINKSFLQPDSIQVRWRYRARSGVSGWEIGHEQVEYVGDVR